LYNFSYFCIELYILIYLVIIHCFRWIQSCICTKIRACKWLG